MCFCLTTIVKKVKEKTIKTKVKSTSEKDPTYGQILMGNLGKTQSKRKLRKGRDYNATRVANYKGGTTRGYFYAALLRKNTLSTQGEIVKPIKQTNNTRYRLTVSWSRSHNSSCNSLRPNRLTL